MAWRSVHLHNFIDRSQQVGPIDYAVVQVLSRHNVFLSKFGDEKRKLGL